VAGGCKSLTLTPCRLQKPRLNLASFGESLFELEDSLVLPVDSFDVARFASIAAATNFFERVIPVAGADDACGFIVIYRD